MEWKNFDQNLIEKITLLAQTHKNHAPFEWFILGFIYAHPFNNRSLDKIFGDIHTIVNLNQSEVLSIEDTNGILMKVVQNLLSSRTNHGTLPKKQELSTMETDRKLSEEAKYETNMIEEAPVLLKQRKNKLQVPEDISTTVQSPRESTMDTSKEKSHQPKRSELMGNSKPSKLMYDDIDECDISFDSDEHDKKVSHSTKIIEEKPLTQAKPSKSKPEPEPVQPKKTTKQSQDLPASSKNSTKETELTTSFKPKQLPEKTKAQQKVHDPFEDDISFNSEDDDDLKLTKKNQPPPSKITKEAPAKGTATEFITKAVSKTKEKKAEPEVIKPAVTKKNVFEEDDFSYESGDGGQLLVTKNQISKGNNKVVENKQVEKKQEGKQSVTKKIGEIEVEAVDVKITFSSLAKTVRDNKKSVTKEPPPALTTNKQYERNNSVLTEDIFHSEDEASRSFILKHSENPNKSFNDKSTSRIAMEEESPLIKPILMNSDDEDGGSNIALLKKKDNKSNSNQHNIKVSKIQEKDEDDWFALENNVKQEAKATKSFLAGSQESKKKPALKRNETNDDLVINLSDDENEEGGNSFIRDFSQNSRFRKQKISQEDFQTKDEKEMPTSFTAAKNSYQQQQPQLSQGMKQKAQQVIDETDAIELIETPPESPVIRKSFAVKRQEPERKKVLEEEEYEEQQIVYSKKAIEDIHADGPKSLKELRDIKRLSKQERDIDKLSEQLAKKLQAQENAKAGKGRSKGKELDTEDLGRASKRKKQ